MANKPMHGSICLSDLGDAYKAGHSAFNKSEKNGKVYANIAVWMNDQPDQYGNILSFQLNSKKDATDEKVYFGNAKLPDAVKAAPVQVSSAKDDGSDLPF
jgi:hypothetical protein